MTKIRKQKTCFYNACSHSDAAFATNFISKFMPNQLNVKSPVISLLLISSFLVRAQDAAWEVKQGSLIEINRAVVSFQVGSKWYTSDKASPVKVTTQPATGSARLTITLTNTTKDTLTLHNVIPFAPSENEIFITGKGNHRLSRTHLFRPGRIPVNVIVPDNAWDLGYASIDLPGGGHLFGLTRRVVDSWKNATRKRFETILNPGGSVTYNLFAERYQGTWQDGLRLCFQEKKLYDVQSFDESMYSRQDLKWIRKAYVMHLMMAWDKDYFDMVTGKFNWTKFQQRGAALYGGDDVICLWPTWPTLGLDQRNQFDMYRDLPGGLATLRKVADTLRKHGTKFFIAYNPWDESTRKEGHLSGLSNLIRETSADGVVLDTKGESSRELQQAADDVKPGVIMYSEGMAVPKDMPGIVSGRVHNALYYPPVLNLNRLIRPDFAIFRVAEVFKEPIQREYAVAFFNGYGTEINQFAPGHPDYEVEQYRYLGRTSMILRENSEVFQDKKLIPLIDTSVDSVWATEWHGQRKRIVTLFSIRPEGYEGALVEGNTREGFHWVDLWQHEAATLTSVGGKSWVRGRLDPFDKRYLGSNNEGVSGCLAEFPSILKTNLSGQVLTVETPEGTTLKIWAGDPSYEKKPLVLGSGLHVISLIEKFDRYQGKFVVQAFEKDELVDETYAYIKPGAAFLTTRAERTKPQQVAPEGMTRIPAGRFTFKTTHGDEFIPYPVEKEETLSMPALFMDKYPVTNAQFRKFLEASKYSPLDTSNFLRHWVKGGIPKGQEEFPVTYVSWEDAKAYAEWAGKRLPTEREWQYAAQTDKMNEWPWKQTKPVTRKEQYVTETLTVKAIEGINPAHCNLGDGLPYRVGKYKAGVNPFGLYDLVGSVWQLTADLYESDTYRYIMMKGGSYFKPSSSWWYVQGGPRELHYRQYLLRVSQGFERNATVGFRCVVDGR